MSDSLIRGNDYNSVLQKWINKNNFYKVKKNNVNDQQQLNNKSKGNLKNYGENTRAIFSQIDNKSNASHNLLNGGQYMVPDNKLLEFYEKYSEDVSKDLQNNGNNFETNGFAINPVQHSLSENGYSHCFPIFIDLDLVYLRYPYFIDYDFICLMAQIIQQSTRKFYPENDDDWWFKNGLMIITHNKPTEITKDNNNNEQQQEEEHKIFPPLVGIMSADNYNNKSVPLINYDEAFPNASKCDHKLGVHIHFPNLIVNLDRAKLMYKSWITDLDKYLSYNDYFSNKSLLKLYINPNDPDYSLFQWTRFIDIAVYNSTPHLRMLFSHKIKACDACCSTAVNPNPNTNNKKNGEKLKNNININNKNKKNCSKCQNTRKIDAGYNSLHFPVYILNGDGSPTEDHLKIIKKTHKIIYEYQKITFFDNKYIKVCKPMRTDIVNIFQGQQRIDFINKMVNYCRVCIPNSQSLTETFIENSQYIELDNPKNYFLTSDDLAVEVKKNKRKNKQKNSTDFDLVTKMLDSSFKKRRNIEKIDDDDVKKPDINNWLLYNNPEIRNILNQDINRRHKEWADVKITTIRTPNKEEKLFIINVDNKYAKYCENVNRFHTCSNIYFVLTVNGLSQRCFSQNQKFSPTIKCNNFRGEFFSYQNKYLAMFNTKNTLVFYTLNKDKQNFSNRHALKDFNKHENIPENEEERKKTLVLKFDKNINFVKKNTQANISKNDYINNTDDNNND